MNHEQFTEWLQLSLYDELSENEKHLLDEHLKACRHCASQLEQFKRLHHTLQAARISEAPDLLLQEAREELRAALRLEQSRRSIWSRLTAGISSAFAPSPPAPLWSGSSFFKAAAGALAMLTMGLLLGYIAFYPTGPRIETEASQDFLARGDVDITNVRFLDWDAKGGQIELSLDAVKHVRMKGNINDQRVQKVLVHALLNSQNPGIRLNAVNAIGTSSRQLSDRDMKAALILALQSDENPGVRKEALTTLQKYPSDEEIKRAFLHVLMHDNNSGLRIEAIRSLETAAVQKRRIDEDLLGVLKEKMASDDNDYVRIRAKSVLEEVTQK